MSATNFVLTRRTADLCLRMGNYQDAAKHYSVLIKALNKEDSDLSKMILRAYLRINLAKAQTHSLDQKNSLEQASKDLEIIYGKTSRITQSVYRKKILDEISIGCEEIKKISRIDYPSILRRIEQLQSPITRERLILNYQEQKPNTILKLFKISIAMSVFCFIGFKIFKKYRLLK